MRARTGWQVAALCSVPFIMVLGNSMLIPVLPAMREALNITRAQAGLTITAFSIPAGIAISAAGYLADRFGRKTVMIPALLTYAAGGVVAFLAALLLDRGAYPVVLAGRVLQGVGAAGTAPVALAMVGDLFQSGERAKALGLLEASNGLGKVLSPILGAAVGLLGWYAVFAGYAALTLPAAAAVWLLTRETVRDPSRDSASAYFRRVWDLFRRQASMLAAAFVAGAVVLFVLFGVLFYLSETLEAKYQLDGIPKGGVLAVPVLAMAATAYITGSRLSSNQRLLRPAVLAGLALGGAGMALVPLLGGARAERGASDWIFFGGLVVLGVGSGLVLPALNTLVTAAAPEAERGMLTATYSATRFFGVALGPPIFGWLMGVGRATPFLVAAAVLGATAAAGWFLLKVRTAPGPRGNGTPEGKGTPEAVVEPWQPPSNLPPGTRRPVG